MAGWGTGTGPQSAAEVGVAAPTCCQWPPEGQWMAVVVEAAVVVVVMTGPAGQSVLVL